MALLGKTDWYSAEKKIVLTIALGYPDRFCIGLHHSVSDDEPRLAGGYSGTCARGECLCESHLNLEGFVHINTLKDMRRDTYQDMQSMLDNIRQIANVRYLYTAKFNDRGQPMYLVDGLPPEFFGFPQSGRPH